MLADARSDEQVMNKGSGFIKQLRIWRIATKENGINA
jgi:hypothetical protein